MNSIRQYQVPLQKYVAMMDLQVRISTHLSYIEQHEICSCLFSHVLDVKLSAKDSSVSLQIQDRRFFLS